MDPIDYQILDLLQRDARTTQLQIAAAVGLSQPSVADRIRKLDASGAVLGYVARLDPRQVTLSLVMDQTGRDLRPAWSLDHVPEDVLLAVNAGQFAFTLPWGWVVLNGKQFLPAGTGPLSSAFVVDSAGAVRWVHGTVSCVASSHQRTIFPLKPTRSSSWLASTRTTPATSVGYVSVWSRTRNPPSE